MIKKLFYDILTAFVCSIFIFIIILSFVYANTTAITFRYMGF